MFMHNIAVIGDHATVLCFKALGMDVFPVSLDDAEKNRKIIDKLAKESYGLIFVTEEIAIHCKETIDRYKHAPIPAIIVIPSSRGSLHVGLDIIQSNVERAVGINILDDMR